MIVVAGGDTDPLDVGGESERTVVLVIVLERSLQEFELLLEGAHDVLVGRP